MIQSIARCHKLVCKSEKMKHMQTKNTNFVTCATCHCGLLGVLMKIKKTQWPILLHINDGHLRKVALDGSKQNLQTPTETVKLVGELHNGDIELLSY
jgi:hypothetical protein